MYSCGFCGRAFKGDDFCFCICIVLVLTDTWNALNTCKDIDGCDSMLSALV